LEGCPNGLKKLHIGCAPHLSDLSPLASCSMMQYLLIRDSSITDISVVALMPLLEMFVCEKDPESSSIKDLSPLASCPRMRLLWLGGNEELKDLSPLSSCAALEDLDLINCRRISSLAPLSNLRNLKKLHCRGIDPRTSLFPLASCTGLEELMCMPDVVDLEEVRNRMPQVKVIH
jgi:Leucine-rich repeat (LRR) protein